MLFFKSQPPQIEMSKSDCLLMIQCFVKHKMVSKLQCVIESDRSILIGDIIHTQNRNYNKGYGSLMMKKLIEYTKENGYTLIHGNLSLVDADHKGRLYHFYEKFGFIITEFPEPKDCYYGEIRKIITEVNC